MEINFSLQLSSHAALKITELFKTELLPALGMHYEALDLGSVLQSHTARIFRDGGDLKYSIPLSDHVLEHVSDHVA